MLLLIFYLLLYFGVNIDEEKCLSELNSVQPTSVWTVSGTTDASIGVPTESDGVLAFMCSSKLILFQFENETKSKPF